MPDRFAQLRQFGEDMRNAITAKSRARLGVAQFKNAMNEREEGMERIRKQDKRIEAQDLRQAAKDEEIATQKKAQKRAGEILGKKGIEGAKSPEFLQAVIEGGANPLDVATKLLYPKEAKTPKPTRYEKRVTSFEMFYEGLNEQLKGTQKQLSEAMIAGDDAKSRELQQAFTAQYDAGKEAIQSYYDDFVADRETATYQEIGRIRDQEYSKLSPQEIGIYSDVVIKSMGKTKDKAALADNLKKLETGDHEFSKYVDTSGVMSTTEINNFLDAARVSGRLSKDQEDTLLSLRGTKDLTAIATDKDAPEVVQLAATVLLKNFYSAKALEDRTGRRIMKFYPDEPKKKGTSKIYPEKKSGK